MSNKIIEITNSYLKYHKYDINALEKYIHNFCKITLLKTQKLTVNFCVKYILDLERSEVEGVSVKINKNKNKKTNSDISIDDIVKYQKHLTKSDIVNAYTIFQENKNKMEQEQKEDQKKEEEEEKEEEEKIKYHSESDVSLKLESISSISSDSLDSI